MAKVLIHVRHKVSGEIVAIGRPMGGAKCVPLGGKDQAVIETEVEEEEIAGLHRTHIVDVVRRAIVKHSDFKK